MRGSRNSRSFAPDLLSRLKDLLTVDLFRVYLLPRVDIAICYIDVDFVCTSALCSLYRRIRYIEVRYIKVLFHTFYCNFGRDMGYYLLH